MQIILKSKTAIIRFFGPFRMKISGLLITQHPSDLRITDTPKHAYIFENCYGFIDSKNCLHENLLMVLILQIHLGIFNF